jgi:hypothetical protein
VNIIDGVLFRHMKDLEYLSDYRNKRIGNDLDKQMMKHLELLCINAELVQLTGSTSQKMQLIESLRKINNLYLVEG